MDQLLITLGKFAVVIYLVLILVGVFSARALWTAWMEWREAYYGLEREMAMRKMARWVALSVLLLTIGCAEISLVSFVLPGLPASSLLATPTLNLLAEPAGPVLANSMDAEGTPPQVVATITGSEGCVPGRIEITSPRPGAEIAGVVDIIGSVAVENFGFYKYEVSLPGSNAWATIYADRETHKNESLGRLNTSVLTPGDYLLRLVVTDNQGRALPACTIPIRIKG